MNPFKKTVHSHPEHSTTKRNSRSRQQNYHKPKTPAHQRDFLYNKLKSIDSYLSTIPGTPAALQKLQSLKPNK